MFKHYCEAPDYNFGNEISLFLAGGITGCPDWQAYAKAQLYSPNGHYGTLLNPRRSNFPIHDPTAAKEQITWEYQALAAATIILFWFPKEQIQPIALFELGRWSHPKSIKTILVGCDPEYPRRQDIEIQLRLVRPLTRIHLNLDSLIAEAYQTAFNTLGVP